MTSPSDAANGESTTKKRKAPTKKTWEVFWDLQCPFSKKNWELLPAIKKEFGDEYEFKVNITSLLFHPQAFTGQCAASLLESKIGPEAKLKFIDACYENQELFMNAAVGDARRSEVDAIFANIAEKCGVLEEKILTKDEFLGNIHDWDLAVKPAWTDHKRALGLGVFAVPKSVIDGNLITDSDSSWGPEEWGERLKKM